jgi:Ulp1 family protease
VWLRDIEKSNPQLFKQVHVFSTFFYKKLNSKTEYVVSSVLLNCSHFCSSVQAAYEGVRNWTNKVDIFRKKYIIVPINEKYVPFWLQSTTTYSDSLHWYLAIIYEPEHILKDCPAASRTSLTGRQTRQTAAQAISVNDTNSGRIDESSDIQMENLDLLGNLWSSEDPAGIPPPRPDNRRPAIDVDLNEGDEIEIFYNVPK